MKQVGERRHTDNRRYQVDNGYIKRERDQTADEPDGGKMGMNGTFGGSVRDSPDCDGLEVFA